ncbi:hypothetical protein J7E49_21485 [Variovorax paradoxus]|nr:hypothetical protein [Variovorax paradoxus]
MSTDYAAATIAGVLSAPSNVAVQPPIGHNTLTAANAESWNPHIGTDQNLPVTAADNAPGAVAGMKAAQGTLGRSKTNQAMTWCLCAAGCAALVTGTITAGAFVAGAGAAIAQSAIPANGFGWVVN